MIDMQSSMDTRNIPIAQVGIRNVKYPFQYTDTNSKHTKIQTVGQFSFSVNLPKEKKGTHMSRFLSILYANASNLSMEKFRQFSIEMNEKLDSENSFLEVQFVYFHQKQAPVTKTIGTIDVPVQLEIQNKSGKTSQKLKVDVPIKSLCPCSKAISEYGAHSQRGIISIELWNSHFSIEDCILFAEAAASSPIYSILKREDEKYVTELAYNNPRFVEDLVRETAYFIKAKDPSCQFQVTAENIESIHNHSAWACVQSGDI